MQRKSRVLRYLGSATLFVAAGTLIAQERLAPVVATPYTPTFSFGMIGLGSAATARLNVINLVRMPPPIPSAIAQLPCKVELALYDGQGKLIKQKSIANPRFPKYPRLPVLSCSGYEEDGMKSRESLGQN